MGDQESLSKRLDMVLSRLETSITELKIVQNEIRQDEADDAKSAREQAGE